MRGQAAEFIKFFRRPEHALLKAVPIAGFGGKLSTAFVVAFRQHNVYADETIVARVGADPELRSKVRQWRLCCACSRKWSATSL